MALPSVLDTTGLFLKSVGSLRGIGKFKDCIFEHFTQSNQVQSKQRLASDLRAFVSDQQLLVSGIL